MVEKAAREGDGGTVLLVDPRHPRDFEAGRIPGARNLRLSEVPPESRVDRSLDRYGTIVVYGNDPASASARAMTKRLLAIGYSSVRWFPGGLEEWKAFGGEVEGTGEEGNGE